MSQAQFLNDFSTLGSLLERWLAGNLALPEMERAVAASFSANHFFTPYMQRNAIRAIASRFLVRKELEKWLGNYVARLGGGFKGKRVGIVMAGNIPLVGFHDFLSVMAVGADALVKLSSRDAFLLPAVFSLLCSIDPGWRTRAEFTVSDGKSGEYLSLFADADALIATGSNKTKESISAVYGERPLLARGSRFSYAVIDDSNVENLRGLAEDVFLYFGLGCRSVSRFLVRRGTGLQALLYELEKGRELVAGNEAYMNSYRRLRAIYGMEGREFADGGFFILAPTEELFLPMGLLGYACYDSDRDLELFESEKIDSIQKKYRTFGLAQSPSVTEYADNVDTVNFLIESL